MLFGKNDQCPVGEFDKNLIEKSLCWFENKLGDSYIKSRKCLIPQHCNFEYKHIDSDDAIQYFINFICSYIVMDASMIEYVVVQNSDIVFSEASSTKNVDSGKRGLLLINENGKYQLTISSRDFKDFDMAFLSMAYELTYIKFFSEGLFTFSNGYMINMGMVILGFGFVCSNGAVKTSKWKGIAYSGWRMQRFGFINQRMYGYILALLSIYRSENDSPIYDNLCSDVHKFFKQSIVFIAKDHKNISFLTGSTDIKIADEDVFIRKIFYSNGMLRIIERYKDGKYEGPMTFYHQNGKFWGERIYKNGISFTVLSNYNKDGDPVEKGTLYKGNGTLYIYNYDGSLLRIEEYRDSMRIDV